jgi:hypothetical protein
LAPREPSNTSRGIERKETAPPSLSARRRGFPLCHRPDSSGSAIGVRGSALIICGKPLGVVVGPHLIAGNTTIAMVSVRVPSIVSLCHPHRLSRSQVYIRVASCGAGVELRGPSALVMAPSWVSTPAPIDLCAGGRRRHAIR